MTRVAAQILGALSLLLFIAAAAAAESSLLEAEDSTT